MVYDTPLENVPWSHGRVNIGRRLSEEEALHFIELEKTWIRWAKALLYRHSQIFEKLKKEKEKKIQKLVNLLWSRIAVGRMNEILNSE